ncbi:uncharacterized protein LOC126570253 [Anopheles aquasalis]|uniref:uncharacterized protein LOC126570253 n=1 Tax=Anopheles aquasalis TaxID=42839 RepID=UPI00215AA512|nr:uncharacterized protein LOC126570253 [Anopheles aquasalis]
MKRVLSLGRLVVAQGKNSLTGARKVMDDFVGIKEMHAAQQKVKGLQKKNSVGKTKRSEFELELADITKRLSVLSTERTRLTGMLDAKYFQLQMLQHELTLAMVLEKKKQHQLRENRNRLAKMMLTVMLYLFL